MTDITTNKQQFIASVQDAVQTDDVALANKLLVALKKQYGISNRNFSSSVPQDLALQYAQLEWIALPSLTEDEAEFMLRKKLGEAFTIPGFDFDRKLNTYLESFNSLADRMAFIERLVAALQESQSLIGRSNIEVSNHSAPPAVRYWLQDYDQLPSKSAQRSEIEELQYITSGSNTKTLTQAEQKALLSILKVYDENRAILNEFRSLPEPTEEEAFKDFNVLDTIPGLDSDEEDVNEPSIPVAPTLPAAQPVAKAAPAPVTLRPAPRPLNMQDMMINRGPATTKVDYGRAPIKKDPTKDIDSKLEELKKRTQEKK